MIELPDEKWTPQVTVLGLGDLGVRVLLKLREKQREGMKLCAIVSDKTQLEGHEDLFSVAYVGDACLMEQQSELYQLIRKSAMFLIVADTSDLFSARAVSAIASEKQDMVSFALLMTADDNQEQSDYINRTRAIYMTPKVLRRQCELQTGLFEDEFDVLAETALEMATMPFHNLIGFDGADMREALSRPGKMTAVFGQGNTVEDAVDNLLMTAEKVGVDLRQCELAVFSMSGAPDRLSVYDVNEGPELLAKKIGREMDAFCGAHVTLLSAPLDESLGDKLKIFAVFCKGSEENHHDQ